MTDSEEGNSPEEKKVKTITLKYGEFKVPIKITKNYDETIESIRQSLFLTKEEATKLSFSFLDEYGDENTLFEDTIEDAYEAETWTAEKIVIPNQEPKNNGVSEEEKNKIINDCIKFMNEEIKKINKNWKKKIEDLKKKFQNEITKREKANKSIINNIMNSLSDDAKKIIEDKVNDFNSNITEILNSKIEESLAELNKEKGNIENDNKDVLKIKNEIKDAIDDTNKKFTDIMSISEANINADK